MIRNEQSSLESERITEIILNAWQEGHGGSADRAHVFQGDEGIVLLIPKALYQAELNLLRSYSSGTQVLNRYLRSLLESVAAEVSLKIEDSTERVITETIPLVDLHAGWAIIFYRCAAKPQTEK